MPLSPLDRPLNVTLFPDVKAATFKHQVMSLRAFAGLVLWTDAATKSDLPLFKLARFGGAATPRGALRHDGNLLDIDGLEGDYDLAGC